MNQLRLKHRGSLRGLTAVAAAALVAGAMPSSAVNAAATVAELQNICNALYPGVYGTPNSEPLAACQWNLALIGATNPGSGGPTGKGVTIGIVDSGVDLTHPDIAPNLNVDQSCSFIFDDTPTADPAEIANGDCSDK